MTIHSPNLDLDWLTGSFEPISLADLNEKAEMMSRIDNKYVLQRSHLSAILPALNERFDVLAIDRLRAFTYDTRYFDDAERSAYYEHHQGVRKGFKVRVRRYTDSDLCFLEVKVKGQRGMTEKSRLPYDSADLDFLSPEARAYASATYTQQYGKPFRYQLAPALDVRYRRITLVARSGGERMTIDTDLRFTTLSATLATGTGVFIVETKSANGRGFADLLLRAAHQRPTKRCSKYCIGMAALGEVSRYNHFLPTMRKMGMIAAQPTIGRWSEIRPDLCRNFATPRSISLPQAA
jgi:hypothetical protein